MPILWRAGHIRWTNGHIAWDQGNKQSCCGFDYDVVAQINWSNAADLDLYGQLDSEPPVWFSHLAEGALSLNYDAHPICQASPLPPERVSGSHFNADHVFRFWYNQYSNCTAETAPSEIYIRVINHGCAICVNGAIVGRGKTWTTSTMAYAGYNTRNQPNYASPTRITVTCGPCP